MGEYGFSLTRILHYLQFCPYTGEYESVKTRILEYFLQLLVSLLLRITGALIEENSKFTSCLKMVFQTFTQKSILDLLVLS